MSELPYTTGLTDEFTTLIPTSVSASEWVNQKGSTNFILQNAEFADDTITLTGNNVAWLPIAEPTEYTAYILCKTYIPSYVSSNWGQLFGCRNGTNRCYVGIYRGTDTSKIYKLRTYTTSTYYNPTMDNWHVITLKRTGGYYYVYADGELIISETNTATTRGDKFMIKSITDKGSTPTVDEAITFYLKYCAIFNIVQTDDQIKENCNQILVDFGLKLPEKSSRLAGTDAVAIAYAIARNQESAAALQEVKKAFKDGVREGNDTVVDKTEPLPNDDDEIIIAGDDGDDTFPAEFERGGVYIKTKEITIPDDNGNEVTGVFQLHVGLGEMVYERHAVDGKYTWGYPVKVTLLGNGITKSITYQTGTITQHWKGSSNATEPGLEVNFWAISAKIHKLSAMIEWTRYWKVSQGYTTMHWTLSGDFATALQAGAYVGTMPFDDVI